MRKFSIDTDFSSPNEMTQRRKQGVVGLNVTTGPFSKSTHSELTHNLEVNY